MFAPTPPPRTAFDCPSCNGRGYEEDHTACVLCGGWGNFRPMRLDRRVIIPSFRFTSSERMSELMEPAEISVYSEDIAKIIGENPIARFSMGCKVTQFKCAVCEEEGGRCAHLTGKEKET